MGSVALRVFIYSVLPLIVAVVHLGLDKSSRSRERKLEIFSAAVLVAGPPAKSSAGDLECHASSPSPRPTGCICIVRETEGCCSAKFSGARSGAHETS
jgi:hypothetical protein